MNKKLSLLKKITFITFILQIIFSSNCSPEINLKIIFEKKFPNYIVLNYRKGNFTNSKLDEFVVFLKENKKYQAPPNISKELIENAKHDFEEISKRNDIDKIVVFVLKNNEIKELIEIKERKGNVEVNLFSGEYSRDNLNVIRKVDSKFGSWDGYCYLNDYNGNGLDEILFFKLTGMDFLPFIFEFKNNNMQAVLDTSTFNFNFLSEMNLINEKGKKIIKISGLGSDVIPEGKKGWYKFTWDSGKQMYTMISKGIE
jgi:hypothetical protein